MPDEVKLLKYHAAGGIVFQVMNTSRRGVLQVGTNR